MEQNLKTQASLPKKEGSAMIQADKNDPVNSKNAPAADDGGPHHRGAHRKRTLKEAKVILTDSTVMDCLVRDISEGGARLAFGDAFTLPKEFRLLVVSTNTVFPARLLWQRGLTAGIGFTGPEEPAPARKV